MAKTISFYDRYLAGEHVLVWRELIALGESVGLEPILSDATAVCQEIIRRCQMNLKILHQRLLNLGYEFADPEGALKLASEDAVEQIADFEQTMGLMPMIARHWYMTFDSVNFCQAEHQLANTQIGFPASGPDIFGLGSHPVLVFQSLNDAQKQHVEMKSEHDHAEIEAKEYVPGHEASEFGSHLFLGGWASNCDAKGFELPCRRIDSVVYNDGFGDIYFVDEIREAFQWGGFPFWQGILKKSKFYSPMEYRPDFKKLLPLLKEGLVDL